jgi:Flp pilus assembly protein TadD
VAAFHTVVFSPDGTRLVAGSDPTVESHGPLRMYDARTGQETLALRAPSLRLRPVFSPDGTRIAVVSGIDGGERVTLWEAPPRVEEHQKNRQARVYGGTVTWHADRAAECERTRCWFGAAFHRGRLCELEPSDGRHHFGRAVALTQLGKDAEANRAFREALSWKKSLPEADRAVAHAALEQWEDAARIYGKIVEAPNAAPHSWYVHALLRLQLDDRAGYSRACSAMWQRFGRTNDAAAANTLAWTCALGPGAVADLAPVVAVARAVVRAAPKDHPARNTLGALLYRAGAHAEAVTELNEALKLHPEGGHPIDFLLLAMAHHRLGEANDARKWLEKALRAAENAPPAEWTQRLEWQILRREATQSIEGKSFKSGERKEE